MQIGKMSQPSCFTIFNPETTEGNFTLERNDTVRTSFLGAIMNGVPDEVYFMMQKTPIRHLTRAKEHQAIKQSIADADISAVESSVVVTLGDALQRARQVRMKHWEQFLRKRLNPLDDSVLERKLERAKTSFLRSRVRGTLRWRHRPISSSQLSSETCDHAPASRMSRVEYAYYGSSAAASRRLYTDLESKGEGGCIAALLLRAAKASARAKDYLGPSSDHSYSKKCKHLTSLCMALAASDIPWEWGWACNDGWILYVELPTGQVSFHSPIRLGGPRFEGEWIGRGGSELRIIEYCKSVLGNELV